MIEQLGFPGYFLLLVDIVEFCNRNNIYCQGRGSAANSAVCYALGVTKADAVALGLLFERFLSPERDGPPDIDLDIEHQRREEVIQYVYDKYGRDRAAQVANVITYRPKSALREMAKAVGVSPGQADALTKWIDRWSGERPGGRQGDPDDERARPGAGCATPAPSRGWPTRDAPAVPPLALDLANQVLDYPRHLGIHSGGMVMADRPLVEFCPVEWARMENRSVLQWDKDDCAAAGLVKFDLLGLGMLTMLHLAVDLIEEHEGVEIDLATIPQEPEVYELLCAADTVGVFQVESRAQMATLPRLRPETFYDLVVEVALDPPRPDPGRVGAPVPAAAQRRGAGHVPAPVPRARAEEDARRAAVPGAAHADRDRRRRLHARARPTGCARRWVRSGRRRRMAAMRERLIEGMAERGITGDTAEEIATKLEAFAHFGFPESHSVSFAYLVYSSSWMKLHYPAQFACALLNAQPMGFYSPHTLVRDAIRHGVQVLGPDVNRSRRDCTLEGRTTDVAPVGFPRPGWHADPSTHAVRVGLRYVRGIADALLDRIDDERDARGAVHHTGGLHPADRRRRSTRSSRSRPRGAFGSIDVGRRDALWAAGALRDAAPAPAPGDRVGDAARRRHRDRGARAARHDRGRGDGCRPVGHRPVREPAPDRVRARRARGPRRRDRRRAAHPARPVGGGGRRRRHPPPAARDGQRGRLPQPGGRDRPRERDRAPPTSGSASARSARTSPALRIRGLLERHQGVINLLAHRIETLPLRLADLVKSRDFH